MTPLQFIDEEQAKKLADPALVKRIEQEVDRMIAKHGNRATHVACLVLELQQLSGYLASESEQLRPVADRFMTTVADILKTCGAPSGALIDIITTLRPLFIEARNELDRKINGGRGLRVPPSKLFKGES